jgi:hypothetical protein
MKRSRLVLYVLLVFGSGVLVGTVGHQLWNAKTVSAKVTPNDFRRRYVAEMRSRLKLRDDQVQQLNSILDSTKCNYITLRKKYQPEVKTIQDQQFQQISAMLNDQQVAEYQKMREEREKRNREREQQESQPHCSQ